MKKITKIYEKTVYVASDGKEFDSMDDCEWHEKELEQEVLEKEIERDLGIKTHADYPSLIDIDVTKEIKLFLIKNETDLDRFVKVFDWWFRDLENRIEVDKKYFKYPEVLMLLDYVHGGGETGLYKLSRLSEQFNALVDEVNYKIEQMTGDVSNDFVDEQHDEHQLNAYLDMLEECKETALHAGVTLTYEQFHYLVEKLAKEIEFRKYIKQNLRNGEND